MMKPFTKSDTEHIMISSQSFDFNETICFAMLSRHYPSVNETEAKFHTQAYDNGTTGMAEQMQLLTL